MSSVGAAYGGAAARQDRGYLAESETPLAALLFLLPLVLVYELGPHVLGPSDGSDRPQQIIAFSMLRQFFHLLGAHGQHLPAFAIVAVLVSWHIARKDRWNFNLVTLAAMAAESILLSLPLIALSRAMARYFPLGADAGGSGGIFVMSCGAGVYEEMVFRLMLFSLLSALLADPIRAKPAATYLAIVLISAVAFSVYHYLSPTEHFQWRSFLFRTIAGAYFGAIFLLRGFGITCGCHTSYDVLILML